MSTKQMPHGTISYKVERVTPELFGAHSGQFLFMIKDYYAHSSDRSSNPEASYVTTRERIYNDDRFILMACLEYGIPIGFLAGDMVGTQARILMGYLPASVQGKMRDSIIRDALEQFDLWAHEHEACSEVFYTYRMPGAHRSMMNRGWKHDMSIYRKEI